LATLGELFPDGDPVVAADHEGYYLGFAAPDRLIDNCSRLNKVASSLLRRVNGVGRVRALAEPGGKLAAIAVRSGRVQHLACRIGRDVLSGPSAG
jgi:hypothetical protein